MKFKLDENIPDLVAEVFGRSGHEVHTCAGERLSGAADEAVLQACIAEKRVLVTLDLDFSDIRTYAPGTHPGIWVLRPPKQTFAAIAALVEASLRLARFEPVEGRLWVVDERRVRIRDGLYPD